MRIGLVIPGGLDPDDDRREIPALRWLVARLARRFAVDVVSLRQGTSRRTFDVDGARVHDLGLAAHHGLARTASGLRRMHALVASLPRADAWHGLWLGLPCVLAAAAARSQQAPFIASVMGTELVRMPGAGSRHLVSRTLDAWLLGRASCVTTGSEYLAAITRSAGATARVIPLGVPCEWFGPSSVPNGSPRLLHIADLAPAKDQVTLLDALAVVRSRLPGIHLDVAGTDAMHGAVQRAAEDRGLSSAITFHGRLDRDALRDLCRSASLHVISSRHEAQCVAVVEAAALGVPTVGTRVGLVADGDGTWTRAVPIANPAALADAIVELLADADARQRLADAARAWAAAHDADWTAATFASVYQEAVARGKA